MNLIKTIKVITVLLLVYTTVSAATYYVSPLGDNNNSGTSGAQAFQTVQYAVNQMKAGDELIVLDGFYTGTLKLKSEITIKATNPRNVIFSGADPLSLKFKEHTKNIYTAKVNKEVKQLFYNSRSMTWARWPNASWEENWIADKKWAKATDGTGPGVLVSDGFKEISNLDLKGGYCFLRYGKKNSCYSRRIKSFDGKTLYWDDEDFYPKKFSGADGGKADETEFPTLRKTSDNHPNKSLFFLVGSLDLLDAPGEWFVQNGTLYLYPPDGKNPNDADILVRTADYCINEDEAISDLRIEGIDFMAGSVRLAGENNTIRFENIHFTYINSDLLHIDRKQGDMENKPIYIAGSDIQFEKCLFAGAMQSALHLKGADIRVHNSVFMENNRHATFERRPLQVDAEENYQITKNTFFNNPSDAVRIVPDLSEMQSLNSEFSYNHIFNGGRYNTDASGIYFPSKSQRYAEVHHNWFHNVNGNAVRIDIAGKELNVHHNVIWHTMRALSIEGYGFFNVYNNTTAYNETPAEIIRNVMDHSERKGTMELDFPPIDDWNVLNNLAEGFVDRIGPREKTTHNKQKRKGLLHPERDKNWLIPVVDRGTIQGNITGSGNSSFVSGISYNGEEGLNNHRFDSSIFVNGSPSEINLMPADNGVKGGVEQTEELIKQGVCCLDSFRGAYDVKGDYWYPGSDWMPYGLPVLKTMAEAERFAKKYAVISIVLKNNVNDLPKGNLR